MVEKHKQLGVTGNSQAPSVLMSSGLTKVRLVDISTGPAAQTRKQQRRTSRACAPQPAASREDGFAAMKAEADALKAGKPPKEAGYIDRDGNAFRAHVEIREEGARRHIPGPWRPDEETRRKISNQCEPQPAA